MLITDEISNDFVTLYSSQAHMQCFLGSVLLYSVCYVWAFFYVRNVERKEKQVAYWEYWPFFVMLLLKFISVPRRKVQRKINGSVCFFVQVPCILFVSGQ